MRRSPLTLYRAEDHRRDPAGGVQPPTVPACNFAARDALELAAIRRDAALIEDLVWRTALDLAGLLALAWAAGKAFAWVAA